MRARTVKSVEGRLQAHPGISNPFQAKKKSFAHAYSRLFEGGQRLGRFLFIRRLYSGLRAFQQRLPLTAVQRPMPPVESPMVMTASLAEILQATQQSAIAFGFHLMPAAVGAIHDYAAHQPCREPNYGHPFSIDDLDAIGQLPDGHRPLRALVQDPLACPVIEQLTRDRDLLRLAEGYLGYFPDRISCHLTWSLAADLPPAVIEQSYPASNFHYDIAGYNFVTAYFYITPVLDSLDGPHEMILRSHQHKPLGMLLRSGRHAASALHAHYGEGNVMEIFGEPGLGFFQDPSCFHRVKPPRHHHRLLLQFRYA